MTHNHNYKKQSDYLKAKIEEYNRYKPECPRCNDNGCPACDGTVGNPYNPEPY